MKLIRTLFILLLFIVSGCSSIEKPFDPFETLGVSQDNIPIYEDNSRTWSGWKEGDEKIQTAWNMVNVKNISEENAKKIIADYIYNNMNNADHILIGLSDNENYFVGEYFNSLKAEKQYRGPARADSYPVIYYQRVKTKR